MPAEYFQNISISVPYFQTEQAVTSTRYHWKCWNRGNRPFAILQWTRSGQGIFECKRGRLTVPADHAFLAIVPERSTYFYPPDQHEPWTFTWINFYGPLACELFRTFQKEFGPVIPLYSKGPAASALRRLLMLLAREENADRTRVSLQAYAFFLEWWREASQPSGSPENCLSRALRFCREHFREPLGVKQMAQEVGMSREHFSRIFLERTGETPAAFIRQLRMDEAGNLLRETNLPLREIAMRSGFYSTRHLMRTFLRIHGVGPAKYRQQK